MFYFSLKTTKPKTNFLLLVQNIKLKHRRVFEAFGRSSFSCSAIVWDLIPPLSQSYQQKKTRRLVGGFISRWPANPKDFIWRRLTSRTVFCVEYWKVVSCLWIYVKTIIDDFIDKLLRSLTRNSLHCVSPLRCEFCCALLLHAVWMFFFCCGNYRKCERIKNIYGYWA